MTSARMTAFAVAAAMLPATACSSFDASEADARNIRSCYDTGTTISCVLTPSGITDQPRDINADGVKDRFICANTTLGIRPQTQRTFSTSTSDSDSTSTSDSDSTSTSDSDSTSTSDSDSHSEQVPAPDPDNTDQDNCDSEADNNNPNDGAQDNCDSEATFRTASCTLTTLSSDVFPDDDNDGIPNHVDCDCPNN